MASQEIERSHDGRTESVNGKEPLVRLDRLMKKFGPVTAVDNVSLEISPGGSSSPFLGQAGPGVFDLIDG